MRTLFGVMALLLGILVASPLLADDVYLKNGRSFEGVVAEVGDTQVRIQLPGGSISLPRSSVARVQKADSSFSEYLRRKREIESREAHGAPGAPEAPEVTGVAGERRAAADWLELARWARRSGFSQGAREAALTAAEINPREPGLASLLRPFGYVYEERLDRWVPYDDSMRLHGFVQQEGQWVSREEAQASADQRLQLQTALAAQQALAVAAEARDLALLSGQMGLGGQGAYGYAPGSTVGGAYDDWGGPGTYSSVFSAPVFGYGGFGFGGRARGFRHPGFSAFNGFTGSNRRDHHEHRGATSFRPPGTAGRTTFATPPRTSGIRH